MARARSGILSAAAALVAEGGVRAVTMAAVARRAVVAKATVYNHFRDRDELLLALLADQREQLMSHCLSSPLADRLQLAATWLSESAALAGLRRHDPGSLLQIAGAAGEDAAALDVVESWCPQGEDPVHSMRWLISYAVAPARSAESTSPPH